MLKTSIFDSKLGFGIPRKYRQRFKTGSRHGKKAKAQVQNWVSAWQESIGGGSKLGLDMPKSIGGGPKLGLDMPKSLGGGSKLGLDMLNSLYRVS
jgi:hypothetical protein